jgi:raffinose/stachyose/melibiose transport system substrate-binding protein
MRLLRLLALAVAALSMTVGTAMAQTTVRWLHIEANPAQVKIWEEVARGFEAKNPGVKVEMQFLENEAYKAKLPTILQSKDRPHIIYSWAGGVLKAQVEAGVLQDIGPQLKVIATSSRRRRSRPSRSTARPMACRWPCRRSASSTTRS